MVISGCHIDELCYVVLDHSDIYYLYTRCTGLSIKNETRKYRQHRLESLTGKHKKLFIELAQPKSPRTSTIYNYYYNPRVELGRYRLCSRWLDRNTTRVWFHTLTVGHIYIYIYHLSVLVLFHFFHGYHSISRSSIQPRLSIAFRSTVFATHGIITPHPLPLSVHHDVFYECILRCFTARRRRSLNPIDTTIYPPNIYVYIHFYNIVVYTTEIARNWNCQHRYSASIPNG